MKKVKITLTKSPIGSRKPRRDTVRGLGLTKMHQSVVQEANPAIMGMINKVSDLVTVEDYDENEETTESGGE